MNPAPVFPSAPASTNAAFDEAHVRSIFGDDTAAVIELIELVISDLPRYRASLLAHVDNQRWSEAAKTAHTIKGAASNLGASSVTESSKLLEEAFRRQDFAGMAACVRPLHEAIDSLITALTSWKRASVARQKDVA